MEKSAQIRVIFVDSLIDAESVERPRVSAILMAGFIGFLAGQILGALFELIGASLAHYPGGLSALAKVSSPPWWANALGLLGPLGRLRRRHLLRLAYGNLRALPSQWRVRASDALYVALGVGCQCLVDALYGPFHVRH